MNDAQKPATDEYSDDESPFPVGKGNMMRLILGMIVVLLAIGGVGYSVYRNFNNIPLVKRLSQRPAPTPASSTPPVTSSKTQPGPANVGTINEGQRNAEIPPEIKDTVNYVHSLIRHFEVEYGRYPNTIIELQNLYAIDPSTLASYGNAPYYYNRKANGKEYDYSANIEGTTYNGEQSSINRNLDAAVVSTIDQISQAANTYAAQFGQYPTTIDQLRDTQQITFLKNPFTRKPNAYSLVNNGTGYKVSGQLSTGQEYTVAQ